MTSKSSRKKATDASTCARAASPTARPSSRYEPLACT